MLNGLSAHIEKALGQEFIEARDEVWADGNSGLHSMISGAIFRLREGLHAAESTITEQAETITALEAEVERLKAISDAAFYVVMQWSSGTEESTDKAILALEALFQTTEAQ
jgi:hypothetical protein